jgi:uroporphyrinogen decarboxylase
MNDTFIKACRGEKVPYTPVWLMRQAGRYLPQYMKYHDKLGFMGMAKNPEISAEVTIQPIDEFGVDAAILFSDILTTVEPMGIELIFDKARGPIFPSPIRNRADVDKLIIPDPEEGLPYVYDTVKMVSKELANRVPLIGFAGTPFTVGAYMVEGMASARYYHIKRMMVEAPELVHALMDKVTKLTTEYLRAQIKHGAKAVMLFDSCAKILTPSAYSEFALHYVKESIAALKGEGVPILYFVAGTGSLLNEIKESGADVIGVDWRCRLDRAAAVLGKDCSLQGNLDTFDLFLPKDKLEVRVKEILAMGKQARGHIFNVGDGLFPEIPVEGVRTVVDAVHKYGKS